MTAAELKNFVRSTLVAQRSIAQEYSVFDEVIDFVTQALTTGIPDWTNVQEFNTDGTGAGKFSIQLDTDGNIRFWKTKIDDNIGNQPPTNPEIDEDANWIEVSPGDGSAIKEWTPGIYGDGLVIVFYDVTGTDPSLYKLTEPTRPFESTNFETELAANKWKKMTSDIGDVLDVVLTGLSTASTANVSAADSILVAIGKLQANKQRTIFKDGSQAMEANLDLNNNKILQVAPATANGEAVNFEQLNAALDGLKPKDDVRVATTEDIDLNDLQTVDDVVLAEDDRVLVKDQADPTQNGIWLVKDSAAWERALDADTDVELQGAFVQVSEGTENEGTNWVQYSIDIDLGTTDILWRELSSTVPDATAATKGKIKLAGDLAGTADAPTVPALADKQDLSEKGEPNGYAELDGDGKVPAAQLPEIPSSADLVSFAPAGNIASDTVQEAIEELDAEKQAALGYTAADDAAVVKLTGPQNISGPKTFTDDPIIPDEAYGPGWNGVMEPATKNSLYDKIEVIQFTDEKAQDAVGGILTDTNDIDLDYADATPAITATLKKQAISAKTGVTAAVDDYLLVGDTSDSDNLKKVTVQSAFDAANAYNANKVSLIMFNSY